MIHSGWSIATGLTEMLFTDSQATPTLEQILSALDIRCANILEPIFGHNEPLTPSGAH